MGTPQYEEIYRQALALSPEERRRLAEDLVGSPSGLSADAILATLTAQADTLRKLGVRRIGLFGSHARGEARLDSDIDLLVEMAAERYSLFDVLRISVHLEKVFGRKVDIVTADSIRPAAEANILSEVIYAEIA